MKDKRGWLCLRVVGGKLCDLEWNWPGIMFHGSVISIFKCMVREFISCPVLLLKSCW